MSRERTATDHAVMAGLAALTTWAALTSWGPFVAESGTFLGPLAVMALLLAGVGAGLRVLRVPAVATLLAQAGVSVLLLCHQYADGFLPTRDNLAAVTDAVRVALDSASKYAAPIGPDEPSIAPLLVGGGLLFVVLTDLLAGGLRRAPLAGLVLLAIHSVPAGVATTDSSAWFSFLAASAGFLALLHLDARQRMQRWGESLGPYAGSPDRAVNPVTEAVRTGAGRIGTVAVALALATGLLVPVLNLDLFGLGQGSGGDEIRIRQPVADMRRDLQRRADLPVINVETDDPSPGYLRIAVLNRYTGAEWSSGDRDVNATNQADGELPEPVGVDPAVPRRTWDHRLRTDEAFDSTWLPTQAPAAAVTAEGDWRYDPDTMDFLASDNQTAAGLSYDLTAIDLDFGTDSTFFADAVPGSVDREFLDLPDGVPQTVAAHAEAITEAATSDHERAILLQRWFRSEFDYSLERAPEGTGNETLAGFLSPAGRVGYCEQFASAMGVMARSLGIPARVAVGFLRPDREEDGSWTYSTHDLHAWPELYFRGAGWVRFEPTPAGRAADVPSYSQVPGGIDSPDQGATADPTDEATADPANQPAPDRPLPEDLDPLAEEGTDASGIGTTQLVLLVLAGLVVLLALTTLPRLLRQRLREHRFGGGPDEVWTEVRATAYDLAVPWPRGRSPREVGIALTEHLGPDGTDALDRLVGAVEAVRYGRPTPVVEPVETPREDSGRDGAVVVAALADGVTPRIRRRARWLPRSLWRLPEDATSVRDTVRMG